MKLSKDQTIVVAYITATLLSLLIAVIGDITNDSTMKSAPPPSSDRTF